MRSVNPTTTIQSNPTPKQSNISNFGGDQYDLSVPGQAEQQRTFFGAYYWSINAGMAV